MFEGFACAGERRRNQCYQHASFPKHATGTPPRFTADSVDPNWVKFMTTVVTPVNELFPSGFRNEAERHDWRFGFGVMWWVWDSPRLANGITSGNFYGAYSAMGLGGQFITVLPAHNMVVAHKVDLDQVREENYVTNQEFRTILEMLFSSYCGKSCPTIQ